MVAVFSVVKLISPLFALLAGRRSEQQKAHRRLEFVGMPLA